MKLKVLSLLIFSLSFIGLYLFIPGSFLHFLCAGGIISTVWIDFFTNYKEDIKIGVIRRKASTLYVNSMAS